MAEELLDEAVDAGAEVRPGLPDAVPDVEDGGEAGVVGDAEGEEVGGLE